MKRYKNSRTKQMFKNINMELEEVAQLSKYAEEIMPLSAAERQKRYRERLKQDNPEKWKEIQRKNLLRAKKHYTKISELPEEEKAARRKHWRNLKLRYSTTTVKDSRKEYKRKYIRKHRKLIKENAKLKKNIEKIIKENKRLKKRIYRYKILQNIRQEDDKENEDHTNSQIYTLCTPKCKTNSFVKSLHIPSPEKDKVKRELFPKNVLIESMKTQYAKASNNSERAILKKIVDNDVVRKYKMTTKLRSALGLKSWVRTSLKRIHHKHAELASKVEEFFNQDDVSRATAGKKQTKTKNKIKMQRRYLLNSMTKLRYKFIQNTGTPISYPTFTRLKPFYVLSPNLSHRNTCVCKKHDYIEFKFTALKRLKVFDQKETLDKVLESTVCDIKSQKCMFALCNNCKNKQVSYDFSDKTINDVTWLEWTVKNIEYEKENIKKKAKKMVREIKTGTVNSLVTEFEKELKDFKIHVYNIVHQYKSYKNLKQNLQKNEIILHCDFSENYTCKLHSEIQAVHFGASHSQITLHTSMIYSPNNSPESYCTLSDCNKHTPESIWAHLKPLLLHIKNKLPHVDTVHFYSDGPSSQYRQKKNFYLFNQMIKELGFQKGTWNFFEAAHGKGAADGIGGIIKRTLDQMVAYGEDVTNADIVLKLLQNETNVKLYLVTEEHINDMEKKTKNRDFVAVPGTLKIHQIISRDEEANVGHRILSCFCKNADQRGFCPCYSVKTYCLVKNNNRLPKKRRNLYSSSESDVDDGNGACRLTKRKRRIKYSSSESDVDDSKNACSLTKNNSKANDKGPSSSKSKVTILANVKVDLKPTDLKKLLVKTPKDYNISSYDLKTDFRELIGLKKYAETGTAAVDPYEYGSSDSD